MAALLYSSSLTHTQFLTNPSSPFTSTAHKFTHCFSSKLSIQRDSTHIEEAENQRNNKKRNHNRHPKPSFEELVREKWGLKIAPLGTDIDSRVCGSDLGFEGRGSRVCDWGEMGGAQMGNNVKFDEFGVKEEDSGEESGGVSLGSGMLEEGMDEGKLGREKGSDMGAKSRLGLKMTVGKDCSLEGENVEVVSACDQVIEESENGGKAITLSGYVANVEVSIKENVDWMQEEEDEVSDAKNIQVGEMMIVGREMDRLRNVALRMKERIKVGEEGVRVELVRVIHEKWKIDEVVKLKFEGARAVDMGRIHEDLERRTGGLVIWSCGRSLVLFRGTSYSLESVQSCNGLSVSPPGASMPVDGGSKEKLVNKSKMQLDSQLSNPSGHHPLTVDADTLPGVVHGYKPPFRLLPHRVRPRLSGKRITFFRRRAAKMHPHFVLGRSRELEGLAAAMLKLWETSAIVKIVIKPGVSDTCIDRMAEELKASFPYGFISIFFQSGGTVLSMNQAGILFHRGNDFLPPVVAEALRERESTEGLKHEEESRRDELKPIYSYVKVSCSPFVAGTLAETAAAISFWGNQPTNEDVERMLKESADARHASLVKDLEKRLALAEQKLAKAEKGLAEVQEGLVPAELPTDSEIITEEERFLLQKMGSSMKPYLILGRRGFFDGTIENIHLHWKYRELVKIIVKRKTLARVEHFAVSLEAESGGSLISIDETMEGHAIILYRGKNYVPPLTFRAKNLLTKRQALARAIELQRRGALKRHIADLHEQIDLLMSSKWDDAQTAEEGDHTTLS
ncbi:CRM-domain containing factor CFM3, chloroplastic/mitochondrial-like protein [Drosera capensis]